MACEVSWKKEPEGGTKVHGMTIREIIDERIAEVPYQEDAWGIVCYLAGYFGNESSPCVDAGIVLKHLIEAVHAHELPIERRYL